MINSSGFFSEIQTINFNQSYISYYFESLLAIYRVDCWFLSNKIQLVSSLKSFSQMVPPDLLEKFFCHSEHFVVNKKDENYLTQSLLNIVCVCVCVYGGENRPA